MSTNSQKFDHIMFGNRFLWTLLLASTTTAEFYVSLSGNDGNPGSIEQPFATLGRAQAAVRTCNGDLSSNLLVHVEAGTYYLDRALNFTALDSGSNGHRVVWTAETANGGVNISGGLPLTDWKPYDTTRGIWAASAPIGLHSRHFYANQRHAQRARQPLDRDWLFNTTDGYRIADSSADFLLTTPNLETGEIRSLGSFTDRYVHIKSVRDEEIVMVQPAWSNNIQGWDHILAPFAEKGFFVENVSAFLDEADEYYLDSDKGMIYYIPPPHVQPPDMYLVLAQL